MNKSKPFFIQKKYFCFDSFLFWSLIQPHIRAWKHTGDVFLILWRSNSVLYLSVLRDFFLVPGSWLYLIINFLWVYSFLVHEKHKDLKLDLDLSEPFFMTIFGQEKKQNVLTNKIRAAFWKGNVSGPPFVFLTKPKLIEILLKRALHHFPQAKVTFTKFESFHYLWPITVFWLVPYNWCH